MKLFVVRDEDLEILSIYSSLKEARSLVDNILSTGYPNEAFSYDLYLPVASDPELYRVDVYHLQSNSLVAGFRITEHQLRGSPLIALAECAE